MEMKIDKLKAITLALVLVLVAGAATAVWALSYIFPPSDPLDITVNPTATPEPTQEPPITVATAITASTTQVQSGNTVTLYAQLNQPLQGIIVDFKEGDTIIGSPTTDVSGLASYTFTPPLTDWPNSATHTYRAYPRQP